MRLPRYEELEAVPEQLDVLLRPFNESMFVVGPPGSGKTSLALHRASALLAANRRVLLVTFNRPLRQLCRASGPAGLEVRTLHSHMRHYWSRRFHRHEQLPMYEDRSGAWCHDWGALLELLSKSPESSKPWDVLIVDEGQDLPAPFYRFAREHLASTLVVFADDDQAITDRYANIEAIKQEGGLPQPVLLEKNHRNTTEIARVAEHFHDGGRVPTLSVVRGFSGARPRLLGLSTPSDIAGFVHSWWENRGGRLGVIGPDLRRLEDVQVELGRLLGVAPALYKSKEKNEHAISFDGAGITLMTTMAVKGQEFDAVVLIDLKRLSPWASGRRQRLLYMVCSRARDYLFLCDAPQSLRGLRSQLPASDILKA